MHCSSQDTNTLLRGCLVSNVVMAAVEEWTLNPYENRIRIKIGEGSGREESASVSRVNNSI